MPARASDVSQPGGAILRLGPSIGAALVVTVVSSLCAGATAEGAYGVPPGRSSLSLGFFDGAFGVGDARRLDEAAAIGASVVRIPSSWASLSPRRPLHPTDPADRAYEWRRLDAAVRAATSRGLRVLIALNGAPAWAEGPWRPAAARPGTWRPDPVAFGRFAVALATRYSGRYGDAQGAVLPRAYAFQPWNEPNLYLYLAPQWTPGLVAASPPLYRALHNAFYRGVKAIAPGAVVVTAGTAPFGEEPGGDRIAPARFWREVLCLSRALRPLSCPAPLRFDALAHHPYSVGGPSRRALNVDDVTVPDLGKLTRIVRRALATGSALPRRRKRLWVTEFSWDSRPPDPDGVPSVRHANWLQDALYVLWRQGVDTLTWFQVRDQLPSPSYSSTSQSGVLFVDGRPKLAARAFQLPLVLRRTRRGALVFSRAPRAGTVQIQRADSGGWRTVARVRLHRDEVLLRTVPARAAARLRLLLDTTASIPRRVPREMNPHPVGARERSGRFG
jgi:hypothetical protein